ncbi:extracellular solute-binding protein [Arthrobacter tecti]
MTADTVGTDLVPDFFTNYPGNPVREITEAPGDGQPITGSVPSFAPIPPGVDSNEYWQALNERLGSPLEHAIVPAADYPARFATSVAGGTLGDFFSVDETLANLPAFMESECADLTEYLAGDAISEYPFLANIPTDAWRGTIFNGRINAIPIVRGSVLTQVLFTRNDLFEARGVDPNPASIEEFVQACRAMTDARNNTWALSAVPMIVLQQMLGVPNEWVVDGGAFTSSIELEEYKEALEIGRQLIADELVHPDSVGAAAVDLKDWFAAEGSAAMMQDTYTAIPGFYSRNTSVDNFEVGFPVLNGPDGQPAGVWRGYPMIAMSALKKNEPERIRTLLKVANYFAAPIGTEENLFISYGNEGTHYTLEGTDPILTDQGRTERVLLLNYLASPPLPLYQPSLTDVTAAQHQHMLTIMPNSTLTPTWGLYSPTEKSEGGRLERLLQDAANSILLGRQPLSSWDDAVANWRSDGGDQIKTEFQQASEAQES